MSAHRINEKTRGVYVISVTPFRDDGRLDLQSVESLMQFYLDAGVDGIVILGMMGEAGKLGDEESRIFARTVFEVVDGRVPVAVGVSNAGLGNLVGLAHDVMEMGAAGVMVAPLNSLRTDAQIAAYFTAVCAGLGEDVPVILQDFPLATTVQMSPPLIDRLVEDLPQIAMLKHEDWPGLNKLTALRETEASGRRRRISILTGNGGLHLPQELDRGADGAMTGFCFPEMLVEVCAAHAAGDRDRAEDIFDAYLPLVRHEAQPGLGLAFRKEALHRRGAIASPFVRQPGPKLTRSDMKDMDRLIDRVHRRLEKLEG
ncbi:dihydrodipicolinate synthase family protein [Rhizobiaceae bacterium BDR2-2]|uniref:Dihydrodipicolinate synthase family protein n=1 Tax=Ectorhizobium quercum TaxID=2965071 RepID=A0AAE3SVX9_9HYPH|nr:dihydrodipicolinate synthase family protein [Ectorhizobium quercum]MCX8997434.1 dihydrodipicolinate synthase family protein [Ectorhizobium quercum]